MSCINSNCNSVRFNNIVIILHQSYCNKRDYMYLCFSLTQEFCRSMCASAIFFFGKGLWYIYSYNSLLCARQRSKINWRAVKNTTPMKRHQTLTIQVNELQGLIFEQLVNKRKCCMCVQLTDFWKRTCFQVLQKYPVTAIRQSDRQISGPIARIFKYVNNESELHFNFKQKSMGAVDI